MKIFDAVALTAAYAANQVEQPRENKTTTFLWIDYTKGDETSMELLVEYSYCITCTT